MRTLLIMLKKSRGQNICSWSLSLSENYYLFIYRAAKRDEWDDYSTSQHDLRLFSIPKMLRFVIVSFIEFLSSYFKLIIDMSNLDRFPTGNHSRRISFNRLLWDLLNTRKSLTPKKIILFYHLLSSLYIILLYILSFLYFQNLVFITKNYSVDKAKWFFF